MRSPLQFETRTASLHTPTRPNWRRWRRYLKLRPSSYGERLGASLLDRLEHLRWVFVSAALSGCAVIVPLKPLRY